MKFTLLFVLLTSSTLLQAQNETSPYIKSIFFGGGSYYIDSRQAEELNLWLDGFPGLEGYDIIINSHTDDIGSREYNQWLSDRRSDSVLRILQRRGLNPETISRKSFGEDDPLYDNATWDGKLGNRRADVILIPPSS